MHSGEGEMLKERFERDQIVSLNGGSSPKIVFPPGWIFGVLPPYVDAFGGVIDWIVDIDWPRKGLSGKPKLAFLTWDNAFGRAPITDEGKAYAAERGVEIVEEQYVSLQPVDTKPQILAIDKAGANYIYSNHHVISYRVSLNDAAKLGIRDKFTWINIYSGVDQITMMVDPAISEGIISWEPEALWSQMEEVPILKDILDAAVADDWGAEQTIEIGARYPQAFYIAFVTRESLERAITEVGWDELNGSSLKAAMETMGDYKVEGLAPKGLGYSATSRNPHFIILGQIQNGKKVAISDWLECPDLVSK
jgi:branched-chain amino acid transport system substrate-binding protein